MMYTIKLSPYAEIFYNEWLLSPQDNTYNLVLNQTLYGNLDIEKLRNALKRYIADNLLLNSHIQNINGTPYWVKNDSIKELEYFGYNNDQSELLSYTSRAFDLHNEPLYRFKLLRIKDGVYRLIFVFHHIVIDGSASLDSGVFKAISNYYNYERYTAKYSLDKQIELITNLTNTLAANLNQNKDNYKEFWNKQLSDIENIDLTFLKLNSENNNDESSNPIKEITFSFGATELAKLDQIKNKYAITPYAYGQCIFALLLHKYTNQGRLAISYPITIKEGIDFIYGAQINTNFIPYQFNQATTILDLFNQNKEFFKLTIKNDIKNGYYPITDIIRDNKNKQLLNVNFVQSFFREAPFEFKGTTKVETSAELSVDGVTKDTLLFEHDARSNKLNYRVRYDKRVIDRGLLNNFVNGYKKLFLEILEDILAGNDGKSITSYNLLDAQQYHQIVYKFNQTEKDYPRNKTIHALFEEQALKTPNNIAVVYEDIKLTYQELNKKANQLANYLRINYAIKPDDLVALCLDRNECMLIAILAVLKSGGAYVPIDPKVPHNRINYILGNTKTKVLLTNDVYKNNLQQDTQAKIDLIAIDSKEAQIALATQNDINPIASTTSNNLIYVIYTSGTTGNPKGVLVEHHSVVNYATYLINENKLNSTSRGSQYAGFGFDAVVNEVYPMILSGGALYIVNDEDKISPAKTNEFFNRNHVTYAFLPTKFAELFCELENNCLINLVIAGEKLENFVKQNYRATNAYGPTEATVHSTSFIIDEQHHNIPIGKPIDNVKCYVVDTHLNLTPVGAIGELMIGGESLARGYLALPNLTAEKFIVNPFQTAEEKSQNKNNRLYKTGDLVRWLPDGNLEYIGRNDFQVKIRGYRIELGEIEAKLASHPEIKQSIVVAKERITEHTKDKYLIAYYVADNQLDQSKLQEYLQSQLPDYMIPSVFVHLQKIPLTENGKLDKKALPEPSLISNEYVAPRSELEKKICEIYAQVLSLPVQQFGIKDDFFKMGGDSISSIQLVSRIRQQLGLNVSVQNIFSYRDVAQLTTNLLIKQNIQTEREKKIIREDHSIERTKLLSTQEWLGKNTKGVEDVYLANNLQQGFIYHAIRHGEAKDAYVSQLIWKYKSPIDIDKFKQAWQLTQNKYPSLRLRFKWDSELIQIIDKNQELDFRYIDLTNLPEKENIEHQSQITKIIAKDRQEHYSLQAGGLIRVYLIKLSKNDYLCLCGVHHIILDGWSVPLLRNSVHEIYSQLLENNLLPIAEDVTYKKAQKYLQEHKDENKTYWGNQIKQIKDRTDLRSLLKPLARSIEIKNHTEVEQEQEQRIEITGQKLTQLKNLCQINAITINAVIQYAWHKILHLYGASNTTVVGTVVSGRNIPVDNIENSVGLFLNTLPLIFTHDSQLDLIEQIKVIQYSINEINSKSNVNLANLQSEGERLFDSLLVYENYPSQEPTTKIKYENIQEIFKVDYPLAIIAYEKEQVLTIRLKYAGELFSEATITQLLTKAMFFVEQLLENPYKKKLIYLNQEEYQRLVIDYNKTAKDYPLNKTIHQLFEEQVLKTPNNIAVVYENRAPTYEELNNKANQLANYLLKNNNIKPDDLIALFLDRSEFIIIAILAILKTGAAYVPIDSSYPDERIKYILEDTKAKIIITNKNTRCKTQIVGAIEIDSEKFQQVLFKEDKSIPKIKASPNNLAYVIYTSGSTGKPKGVMIEHRSVCNLILNQYEIFSLSSVAQRNCLQFASIAFDASVFEMFFCLSFGHTLYIASESQRKNPQELEQLFVSKKIHIATLPPALLINFDINSEHLNTLVIAGESPSQRILDRYLNRKVKTINGYGPTEATVCTNLNVYNKNGSANIGKALNNVKLYVLDSNLNPLPIAAIGELHIGGIGLARGYLYQPQLTAEKFILNPFQTQEEKLNEINSKLYKTGDLVRMLPDGNLEYIGRNDDQIKIRGFRVELSEIESKLLNCPQIIQTAVLVKENENNKYLIAYYVADNSLESVKLHEYLLSQLPDYMIPSAFVHLQKFPLTENGKLDKKTLPAPEFEDKDSYVAPRNKQEEVVCEAFANILELPKVGINDDFFSLGGNSIQAIRLISILQVNFDVKIADIFNLRTPKKLAKSSQFGKNFLQHKLELVKIAYQKKQNDNAAIDVKSQQKLDAYTKSIKNLSINIFAQKPIHNVLLTGSTGYLGCNILNQLLELTNNKIYLLIRANSQVEAIERINKKYQFYFDKTLHDFIDSRVFIIKADIEKQYLALSRSEYQALAAKVDSVIHAAALVKHYGEYDKFYSANVGATINLLEFTKLTKLKDFHYVSTASVLSIMSTLDDKEITCTEDDIPNNSEILDNVYAQTKLLGEHQAIKYRDYGINCNIYRVGNLAFISKNYRAQENIEDNAFYNWLKCLFTIRSSAEIIDTVEISSTDLTAQAIVKIFDKQSLNNQIYHVFNPYLFDMTNIFKSKNFKILSTETFIDNIAKYVHNGDYYDLIIKFLLRQGWLDWWEEQNTIPVKILQNRTQCVLKELDFKWSPITEKTLYNYFDALGLNGGTYMKNHAKIFSDLERLAPLIPSPVSWIDVNGVALGGNDLAFKVVGAVREQIIGKNLFEIYPKNIADTLTNDIKKIMLEKKAIESEESIVDIETGKTRWLITTKAPLFDDDNLSVVGVVATTVDITARKDAEEKLKLAKEQAEAANEFKTQFLQNMEHDLRTPTLGIASMAENLAKRESDPAIKSDLHVIANSGEQLLKLLTDIIHASHAQAGKFPLCIKTFNLINMINGMVDLQRPIAQSKRLQLTFNCQPDVPQVISSDEHRISRILVNLVSNAIKFTHDGYIKVGIEVAEKVDDTHMVLSLIIEDTGIGIPKKLQTTMYERFVRGTPSNQGNYSGSGLGLSIVKQYIDELKGEIDVESTVDKGTTFTCLLPVQLPTPKELQQYEKTNQKKELVPFSTTRNLKILLVEDSYMARSGMLNDFKEYPTIQVDVAETGAEAVNKANQGDYDLIFMDLGLPDTDGYEVTKKIIKFNKNNNVPILALTAHDADSVKEQCVAAGMNGALSKPLGKQNLSTILYWLCSDDESKPSNYVAPCTEPLEPESHDDPKTKAINWEVVIKTLGKELAIKILGNFVKELAAEQQVIATAIEANDLTKVAAMAHKIKGGAMYAAAEGLRAAALDLEKAAKEKRQKDLRTLFDKFKAAINEVAEEYNQPKSEQALAQPSSIGATKQTVDCSKLTIKILLIEDSTVVKDVTLGLLRDNLPVAQIDAAETGQAAIDLATKNNYDIIFMDLGLPDMDGYEVTKAIRKISPAAIIVAVSAQESSEIKGDCLSAGMNDAFNKPLDTTKVQVALQLWMDKKNTATNTQTVLKKIIDWTRARESFGNMEQAKKSLINFIQETETSQPEIEKAINANDFKTIAFIANRIKGNALYCGTEQLVAISSDLYTAAQNKDKNTIKNTFAQLTAVIKDTAEELVKQV